MKTRETFFHRVLSMLLTAAMVVTLFTVTAPTEAQAAELSFNGKGTSAVTITEDQCYDMIGGSVTTNYIKYKPSVTGTVTLKFQNASDYPYSYGYVTFCDKNQKSIGQDKEYWNDGYKDKIYYTTTYGVKKNTTYYFAVQCSSATKITATTKAIKDSSASKKSKAKNLSKGKKTTGVITAGDSKADWYKIKLTKSAKLKLSYEAQTNGSNNANGFKITFYDKNGKMWTSNSYSNITRSNPKDGWDIYMKSSYGSKHNIATGTYYVKVERMSKASSGSYTLKWSTY